MALPTNGTISFEDLKDEFGDVAPTGLGEFYKGGTYIPYNALSAGSGTISIGSLRGISRYWERYLYNNLRGPFTPGQPVNISGIFSNKDYVLVVYFTSGTSFDNKPSILSCYQRSTGNLVWSKIVPRVKDICFDDSGYAYVVSSFYYYIFKVRLSNCELMWSRNILIRTNTVWYTIEDTDARFSSILFHTDGYLYITGNTVSPEIVGGFGNYILKYSTNGTRIWERIYHSPTDHFGKATNSGKSRENGILLQSLSNSSLVLVGYSLVSDADATVKSGGRYGYLQTPFTASVRTSDGNISNLRTLGKPADRNMTFMSYGIFNSTNRYAICAYDKTGTTISGESQDVFLVKFSSDTQISWVKNIGIIAPERSFLPYVPQFNSSSKLQFDSAGNIYISTVYFGRNLGGGKNADVYVQYGGHPDANGIATIIQKYNSSGTCLWSRKLYRKPEAKDNVACYIGMSIVDDKLILAFRSEGYEQDPWLAVGITEKDIDMPMPDNTSVEILNGLFVMESLTLTPSNKSIDSFTTAYASINQGSFDFAYGTQGPGGAIINQTETVLVYDSKPALTSFNDTVARFSTDIKQFSAY